MAAGVRVVRRNSDRLRPEMKTRIDYWLLLAVAGLLIVGMLMVYSTTFDDAIILFDDATFYLRRQMLGLLLGAVALVVLLQFDYHNLRRISIPFLGATLIVLFLMLFFGEIVFGARRQILGGSYQPSEVAKLATILYIAHWLSSKGDRIKDLTYGLIPFSVITGVVCALIMGQPDLSTAGLLALTSFTLFFVAGADVKQLGLAAIGGTSSFLFLMLTLPYARQRVDDYLAALRDPLEGASYQLQQVLIALGSGGWFGVGLGEGPQKFGPLPAAHTDGIFAIIGEEVGFIGAMAVIFIYAIFIWRGVRTAARARDNFGFLLATGITAWLAYQTLMNLAVITAVIPFTGIPLPFISYGSSSLVASMIGVGILLSISRDAEQNRQVQLPRSGSGQSAAESVRESFDMWRRNRRAHLSRTRRGK